MNRRALALSLLSIAVGLVGGCPTTPDPTTPTLTDAQKAGADKVFAFVRAAAEVSGALASLGDSSFDLSDLESKSFGTCPRITVLRATTGAIVTVDFGDGCDSAATAGKTVSGAIQLALNLATNNAAVSFDNLVIDGRTIIGEAEMMLTRGTGALTLDGVVDLSVEGLGALQGDLIVIARSTGVFTIDFAEFDLTAGTDEDYHVVCETMTVDPIDNGNFVPESGRATFEIPSDVPAAGSLLTLVMTFDANTPVDGTVSVQVEGSTTAIEHTLPGVAD